MKFQGSPRGVESMMDSVRIPCQAVGIKFIAAHEECISWTRAILARVGSIKLHDL